MLNVADELGPDDVERAGLRRQHRLAIQVAQHKGPDAQGIAHADQLLLGQRHQGVAALDLAQGVDELRDDLAGPRAGDQVQDHL